MENKRDQTVADVSNAKLWASKASAEFNGTFNKEDKIRHIEAAQKRADYEGQIQQSQELLRNLESKISRARSDLAVVQREVENTKAKHDHLMASSPQTQKPAQDNKVATTTPAVPPIRQGDVNSTIRPISVTPILTPAPQYQNSPLAVINERQGREEKQRQEQARRQAEIDRQTQLRENSSSSIFPLCIFVVLGVICVLVAISRHGFEQQRQIQRQAELSKKQLAEEQRQRVEKDRQRIALEWQKERELVTPLPAAEPSRQRYSGSYTKDQKSAASPLPQSIMDKFRAIDWLQFEKTVGLVYELQGYRVTQRGGAKPDGGIDLVIQNNGNQTAVQCKHWKTWKVRLKVVKELFASMTDERLSHGVIVTLNDRFTLDAKDYAAKHNIAIVHAENLMGMISNLGTTDQLRVQAMLDDRTKHCPKCGSAMVWRTKGVWKSFWGCSQYPHTHCRGRVYGK